MPKLSRFYGIEISIREREANHPRARIHASCGEFEAGLAFDDLAILAGTLPARALEMVLAWVALHRAELQGACEAIRAGRVPVKIEPLP